MNFPWDGILSRAKPAACAASPVDFAAREITRRHAYSAVCSGGSSWSNPQHRMRPHKDRACVDIRLYMNVYMPG